MELIIVRHGRPERIENADGPADPPLTEAGHRQAAAVAEWLRSEQIDRIVVSPMQRARQTAAPIEAALGLTAEVVDGVREFDDDHNAYIPMEEMRADKEAWRNWLTEMAETNRDAFRSEVLDALKIVAAENRGRRVAVVCHGGVINIWAADVLGLSDQMFFAPDYTSINRFMVASTGERSVVSLNDIGHLRHLPDLVLG